MSVVFRYPFSVAALVWGLALVAQQNDIPLNRDIYLDIDRNAADSGSTMHTGLRPLIQSRADLRGVMGHREDKDPHYYWITEKLFKEHLVEVNEGDFHLTIDPVFNLELGREFREGTTFSEENLFNHNGRGIWIAADLGPTVSFQTTFYENQAALSGYLYHYAQERGAVPGQGRLKQFNQRGLDFSWAMGNVSWSPRPWLNAQLGNGRHFVGHGYRSTLLSDNTSPYPFIKLSALTNNKRFQYSVLHSKFQMFGEAYRLPTGEGGESLLYWKRSTMHHLGMTFGPAQLGLFSATIWHNIDSNGVRPFNAMELNPVIGLNAAVDGFRGGHKQLVGVDAHVRLQPGLAVYGQFALDDPARGRYAWQAGMHWFAPAGVKDLHLQLEYNAATPFTYASHNYRLNYAHAGQPLAQPLGAAFSEAVAIVDYGLTDRVWLKVLASVADVRIDTGSVATGGGDIFLADTEQADGQGWRKGQRLWGDLSLAYRMNQMTNLQVMLGYRLRDLTPAATHVNSGYLYISICTGLFNRYYDI